MKPKNKTTSMFVIASVAIVVGLAGCSDTSPAPVATTIPTSPSNTSTSTSSSQAAEATSTPEAIGDTASPTAVGVSTVVPDDPGGAISTPVSASCSRLNLNEATGEAFTATIPGFSSRMVREFLEYRPYVSIQEFRSEIGKYVDDAQIAEYEKYVYVPVDPNNSDAATLKQLAGVDDGVATALIGGRPYPSNEAFLNALASKVDAAQLAEASCYLAK